MVSSIAEVYAAGLYHENGPPTEIADIFTISVPFLLLAGITYRSTKMAAEADKYGVVLIMHVKLLIALQRDSRWTAQERIQN